MLEVYAESRRYHCYADDYSRSARDVICATTAYERRSPAATRRTPASYAALSVASVDHAMLGAEA